MKTEEKNNVIRIPGQVMFYSPCGSIHGLWKRRQYTTIKELASDAIPKHFFKAGSDSQKEILNKLTDSLEEVLSFGSPKPDENPNMYVAWEKAHKLLAEVSSP
jgi:hypothetical protein